MDPVLFRFESDPLDFNKPTAINDCPTPVLEFPAPICLSAEQIAQILLSLQAQQSIYNAILSPASRNSFGIEKKTIVSSSCSFSADEIGLASCCASPGGTGVLGLLESGVKSNMRYTKNSSKNLEAQLIPSVAPHHLAPYHNHILSTVHHTNSVHQQNHSTHHHNHHHHHSSTVPPSPPSPKDKCKGMSNGSTTNGVTNNNNGEEVQADRPIGYGAFGVVWLVLLHCPTHYPFQSVCKFYLIFTDPTSSQDCPCIFVEFILHFHEENLDLSHYSPPLWYVYHDLWGYLTTKAGGGGV